MVDVTEQAKQGFNPLNQVYVFNNENSKRSCKFAWIWVLIP